MQKSKTGKFSIFSPLGAKLGFLAGRVGLTQFLVGSGRVGLEICSTQLKSGWKCEQPDFESGRIQNVNPKPDLTISLMLAYLWEASFHQHTRWCASIQHKYTISWYQSSFIFQISQVLTFFNLSWCQKRTCRRICWCNLQHELSNCVNFDYSLVYLECYCQVKHRLSLQDHQDESH